MALSTGSTGPSAHDDAGQGRQESQQAEANKHTAPQCEEHEIAYAICGCEPEGEGS